MSVPAISIRNLQKRFGNTMAVNRLNLEVEQGDVFGFLGPNGAGKTTTMRILATLLRQDAGTAEVMGNSVVVDPKAVRPLIGYMPDSSGAYRDMYVSEYLDFFAAAYRVPQKERARVVSDCIDLTGLTDKKDELIEGLSRGMRQRLGLARCLIHDPQLLILDEPASGLDPRARLEIQEILRTLGEMGKTVLISSHILSELRNMCNKIGIIEQGSMIYSGTIDEALERSRTSRRLEIRLTDGLEKASQLLGERDEILQVEIEGECLWAEIDPTIDDHSFVAEALVQNGHRILTLREEEILLEDAFIKLTDTQPPPIPNDQEAPPDSPPNA
jgi:ABC-2 type transport system ATP-binding protein